MLRASHATSLGLVCVCVCHYVSTQLECMWPLLYAGGEERRRENEQGGRVYAFSPSLLIINVSQVCKIARRSLCSILPSSSPPSGFPFSRSLCLLSTSLVARATSPSPSQSSPKHNAQSGVAARFKGRQNANIQETGNKRPAKMHTMTPSSWPTVWAALVTVCCHNNREMSSSQQNLVPLSVKMLVISLAQISVL